MRFYRKKIYISLIFLIFFGLIGIVNAQGNPDITISITTLTEEGISLSASWRTDGSADWHLLGEDPLDGSSYSHLVYKDTGRIDHFYGEAGPKEIELKPYHDDRIRRIIWPHQEITGTIPEGLTELEEFHRLDLSKNLLDEEIPDYVEDFDELRRLILDHNELTGEIPEEVEGLVEIEVFSLHDNELTGEIPKEIALPNLERLYLHNNEFIGFADIEGGDLSNLEILTLRNNELEYLPEELVDFESLYLLDLRNNLLLSLFGDVEDGINLNNLENINASQNLLGCDGYELPQEIEELEGMTELQRHHTRETWHPRRLSIDLRYNCLPNIPETVGDLHAIDILRLDNNNITGFTFTDDGGSVQLSTGSSEYDEAIPPTIEGLAEEDDEIPFKILSLYNNKLEGSIPEEIGELEELKILRLQNNKLEEEIPEELLNLENLRFLNIENNLLIMPEDNSEAVSGSMDKLYRLYAGRNEIVHLPDEFDADRLRFMHFEENEMEDLPENFGDNFQSIQELTLYKNLLTELPESFENLSGGTLDLFVGEEDTGIYYLDLGTNLIEQFPEEVVVLEDLEYLNLSRQSGQANTTPIRGTMEGSIPEEIGNLTELEIFLIQNNELDRLPEDGWDGLANLIHFYAQSNLLENLPPNMGQLASLERLYLNNNLITDPIPDELTETGNLLRAYLQYNEITGPLPQNSSWNQLERFLADDNEITGGIPDEFVGNLGSVVYFSIYRNELSGSIGEDIGNMQSLRWWDMALNQGRNSDGLTGSIPQSVGNLTDLEMFDFNNNAITEVPDEINDLSSLRYIYGFENQISSFVDNIGNLSNLIDFDFHTTDGNNSIPEFPEEAETLPNLRYFSLGENETVSGEVNWEEWSGSFPQDMLFLNNNDLDGDLNDGLLEEANQMVSFNIRNNNFEGDYPRY